MKTTCFAQRLVSEVSAGLPLVLSLGYLISARWVLTPISAWGNCL